MDDKITLERGVFKALASDTRVKILKLLDKRRHTQSEMAADLGFSIPTVKEHLSEMEKAGLVKQVDEGYKWKYYELTEKSKCILDPDRKRVWIVLGFWIVSAAAAIAVFFSNMFSGGIGFLGSSKTQTLSAEAPMMQRAVQESAPVLSQVAEDSAENASAAALPLVQEAASNFPYVAVMAISIFIILTVLLLVFLLRSRLLKRK